MKFKAICCGIFYNLIAIAFITEILPQFDGYSPFTNNKLFNILLIIIVLEVAVISVEYVTDSAASELVGDSIMVIFAAIINALYLEKNGIFPFGGQYHCLSIWKYLFCATSIVCCWASFNGTSFVSSKIAAHKLKKVG